MPAPPEGTQVVWFVIELLGPGGDAQPIACDYGKNPGGPRIVPSSDGCKTVSANQGYKYLLDSTRPTIDVASMLPKRFTDLTQHRGSAEDVPTKKEITNTTLLVSDDDTDKIKLVVSDVKTGGSGFNSKLNWTGMKVTVDNKVRYYAKAPDLLAKQQAREFFWANVSNDGYTVTLEWTPVDGTLSLNKVLNIKAEVTDYAGNTIVTPPPYVVDTTPATIIFKNAVPTTFVVSGPLNVTGHGGSALLNVTLREPTLNASLSTTSVQAYLFAKTRGGAVCTQADRSKCLFITPMARLSMLKHADGQNKCARVYGANSSCFVGTIDLRNISGEIPSYSAFNVNLSISVIDSAGNTVKFPDAAAVRSDVMRIQIGLPVIEPSQVADDYVPTGPVEVRANITDTSPGVDSSTVKLRISNITGDFPEDPEGWTKVYHNPGIYEKTFDARVGNNYRWTIPDSNDGTAIAYQFRAADTMGNLATTKDVNATNLKDPGDLWFVIDKKAPTISEAFPKNFRGQAPHTLTFAVVDPSYDEGVLGSQVDMTSGVLHYRIAGASSYTDVPMTAEGNTIMHGEVEGTFAHGAIIQWWAEIMDKVENEATNGTAQAPHNYTIDLIPPVTTLNNVPATSTSGRFTITATATDEGSGNITAIKFEGRYRDASGLFSAWTELNKASETEPAIALCLAAGVTYEFRAYSIDEAGNIGERSDSRSTTVSAPGCIEELVVTVSQPAPQAQVDAEFGNGTKRIVYVATSTGSFTTDDFIRIRIDFSPDDGAHWITIARDVPNTGEYLWTVDAPTCDKCVIRVNATGPGGLMAEGRSANFAIIHGNPTTDFDGNGLYDECELRHFKSMGVQTDSADVDGDGLDNQEECVLGTDPSVTDTDGDGASDGVEARLGTNPLVASDAPTDTQKRYEQWGSYYLLIPVLFLAVTAVFLLGLARRW